MKTAIIITRKGDTVDCNYFESASEARNEFRALKQGDSFDSAELWDSSNGRIRRIKNGGSKINPEAANRKFFDKPEAQEEVAEQSEEVETVETEPTETPEKPAAKRGRKPKSKSE